MADVPLYVIAEFSSSERRITPSWSIAQLKAKLEPITGIPPSCQVITLKTATNTEIPIVASTTEESTYLFNFPLSPYAELHVSLRLSCLRFPLFHHLPSTAHELSTVYNSGIWMAAFVVFFFSLTMRRTE